MLCLKSSFSSFASSESVTRLDTVRSFELLKNDLGAVTWPKKVAAFEARAEPQKKKKSKILEGGG